MVKINGIKATSTYQLEKEKKLKPTLNQILDKMENNFQEINNPNFKIENNNKKYFFEDEKNKNEYSSQTAKPESNNNFTQNIFSNLLGNFQDKTDANVNTQNFADDKSNLLLSVLPMILSNNKSAGGMKNGQEAILKELLKQTNNPRLSQFVQLLPKILDKNNNSNQTFTSTQTQKKEEPKIDSFKKTSEYIDE